MSEALWIRSHVEQLLQREWDLCRVETDDDGDFPFRLGTAACWVTVLEHEPWLVRVYAHAAYGLRPTFRALRELNDIQQRSVTASVQLVEGTVLISQSLSPIGLTQPVLAQALRAVSCIADDIGALMAAMFDGRTPYPAEVPAQQRQSGDQ